MSASPSALAQRFGGEVVNGPGDDADLAIFAINPAAGIDELTINNWRALDDFQTPRMLLVTGLDGQDLDF